MLTNSGFSWSITLYYLPVLQILKYPRDGLAADVEHDGDFHVRRRVVYYCFFVVHLQIISMISDAIRFESAESLFFSIGDQTRQLRCDPVQCLAGLATIAETSSA